MTSQARGKNQTADPSSITELLDANRACLVQVQKGKKQGWKQTEAIIKKAAVSWGKLLKDSSCPEDVTDELTNVFANELEDQDVPHKPLYRLCLAAFAAIQKIVLEPHSKTYDRSMMAKKDTELSAAAKHSKKVLFRMGGLLAAIADRMSLLDNEHISASSQASQNGCVTLKDIDQVMSLLNDLRGGQLDKGVASDELARLLNCLMRVDAGTDGSPLASAMSLQQKQTLVKLLFASRSAGASLYLCRCIMYVLSPGTTSGSNDPAVRQSAFIEICKDLKFPATYTNPVSNAIMKVKRSYARSGRDFMHMVNVLWARQKNTLPRACPMQAFSVNGVSRVDGAKAIARLKGGDIIVYVDQYRTRIQLYDHEDNEQPAFLFFDRMRNFRRVTKGDSNNVFTWQSEKPDDSSSYNVISISIEPLYADGFESAMLQWAPNASLTTSYAYSCLRITAFWIKASRSSFTKHAIPSDGIERATTPSPDRSDKPVSAEDEADEEEDQAANESQSSRASRRETLAMNRNYVDTPGTIRDHDQGSDDEVESGVIIPNSGLPADHPDLNPFSPQSSPRAAGKAASMRSAQQDSASDAPQSDDAPSHVSDSMEKSTADKATEEQAKKGDGTKSASSNRIKSTRAVAKQTKMNAGVALRRSTRHSSSDDKEVEAADPTRQSTGVTSDDKVPTASSATKNKGKAKSTAPAGQPGDEPSSPAVVSEATMSDKDSRDKAASSQTSKSVSIAKPSGPSNTSSRNDAKANDKSPAPARPTRTAKTQARVSLAKQSALHHNPDDAEIPAAGTDALVAKVSKSTEDGAAAAAAAPAASTKKTTKAPKVVLAPKKGDADASITAQSSAQASEQATKPRRSARIRDSLSPMKETDVQAATAIATESAIEKPDSPSEINDLARTAQKPLAPKVSAAPSRVVQAHSDSTVADGGDSMGSTRAVNQTVINITGASKDEHDQQDEGNLTISKQNKKKQAQEQQVDEEEQTKQDADKKKQTTKIDMDKETRKLQSQPSQQLETRKENAVTRSKNTYGSKASTKADTVFGGDDSDLSAPEDDDDDEADKAKRSSVPAKNPIVLKGRKTPLPPNMALPVSRNSNKKSALAPTLSQAIELGRASTPAAIHSVQQAASGNSGSVRNKTQKQKETSTVDDVSLKSDIRPTTNGSSAGALTNSAAEQEVEHSEPTNKVNFASNKAQLHAKTELSQEADRSHEDDDSSMIGKTLEEIEAEEVAQRKAAKGKGKGKGAATAKTRVARSVKADLVANATAISSTKDTPAQVKANIKEFRRSIAPTKASRPESFDSAPPDTDNRFGPNIERKYDSAVGAHTSTPAKETDDQEADVGHIPTDTVEPPREEVRSMPVRSKVAATHLDRQPPTDVALRAAYEEGREEGVELASSFFDRLIDADPQIQKEREDHALRETKRNKALAAAAKVAEAELQAKLGEEAELQEQAELEAEAEMEAEAQAVLDQEAFFDQQATPDKNYLTPVNGTPVQPRRRDIDAPAQSKHSQITVAPLIIGKGKAKDPALAKAKALDDALVPGTSPLFLETRTHDDEGGPMHSSPTPDVAAAIGISSHRKLRRMSRPEQAAEVTPVAALKPNKRPLGLVARDSMLLQDTTDMEIADVTFVDEPVAITPVSAKSRSARQSQPLKPALKATRFASQVEILQRARLVDAKDAQSSPVVKAKVGAAKRKSSDDAADMFEKGQEDDRQSALAVLDEFRDLMSTRINTRFDLLDRTAAALQARLVLKAAKEVKSVSKQSRKLYDHTARAHATHITKYKDGALQGDLNQHHDLFKTAARGLKTHIQTRDKDYRALLDLWEVDAAA